MNVWTDLPAGAFTISNNVQETNEVLFVGNDHYKILFLSFFALFKSFINFFHIFFKLQVD